MKITPAQLSTAVSILQAKISDNEARIRELKKGAGPLRRLPRESWVKWGEGEAEMDVRVIERIQNKNRELNIKLKRLQSRLALMRKISSSKVGKAARAVGRGTRKLFQRRR